MKERPILFSGPMVNAILAGRKSQTRRVIKPQPRQKAPFRIDPDDWVWDHKGAPHWKTISNNPAGPCGYCRECPFGQPGDRLWVRERFLPRIGTGHDNVTIADAKYVCFEDGAQLFRDPREYFPWNLPNAPRWDGNRSKFRPAMFLPRWASRITLEITDVRVERLQAITPVDAIAEGFMPDRDSGIGTPA